MYDARYALTGGGYDDERDPVNHDSWRCSSWNDERRIRNEQARKHYPYSFAMQHPRVLCDDQFLTFIVC